MACLAPNVPVTNPTLGVIHGSAIGVGGIVAYATIPAATPVIVGQIVQAQIDKKSTPLGTTISLSLIAAGVIVKKAMSKVLDSTLSNRTAIKLIQEIAINTMSMSFPLLFGGIGAIAIGWQNMARIHNAIIMPMVVPGITLLLISKVLGHGEWRECLLAIAGGILAIVASQYHQLAVGVVLGSIYAIGTQTRYRRPAPDPNLYKWDNGDELEMVEIPMWVQQCIWLGTLLIGVPVSQLYSIMKHGYQTHLSDKTRLILETVIDNVETMTSIVFYLLWGMAREGSFTDPMSKALKGVPMEWYIPLVGIILVIGTVLYLLYYLDISVPLYLDYRLDGVSSHIASLGMLLLGTYLMALPIWVPAIGLLLGYVSRKCNIQISLLGSTMPAIGIIFT